jgi:hypothetical protein
MNARMALADALSLRFEVFSIMGLLLLSKVKRSNPERFLTLLSVAASLEGGQDDRTSFTKLRHHSICNIF